MAKARDYVIAELDRLGGTEMIMSTNLRLRKDELPYSNQITPEDPGAAVYFQLEGEPMVIACDKFATVGENLWAIAKTIDAIRAIKRWGSSELMNKAFTGFKALPEQTSHGKRAWYEVLDVSPELPSQVLHETARKNYRALCKIYHPDTGGDNDKWNELQEAWTQYLVTLE